MKMFSIGGWSESGKTTLIVRLIGAFRQRGRRVVAVKKTPAGYDLLPAGKDSSRFMAAGAADVMLLAPGETLHISPRPADGDDLAAVRARCRPGDIVLMEGVYGGDVPLIEVWKPGRHAQPKFAYARLAALVSDGRVDAPVPCLDVNDLAGIVRFMEEYHA